MIKMAEFKYVDIEGDWICTDEDCQAPVHTGCLAIALIRDGEFVRDGELIHYKCARCRGTLKQVERQIGEPG